MRVFLIACLAAIVFAVGGLVALASVQKSVGVAYVGDGARVDCGLSSPWAMIRANLSSTATADPTCER